MQQATASGFGDKLSGKDRQARYDIFLTNLQEAESRNAQAGSEDEVYTVDKFSVFTKEELQAMRRWVCQLAQLAQKLLVCMSPTWIL
jgi:hypothetical protein